MKRLKLISGLLALVFWFSSFFVWSDYARHLPNVLELDAGRIYPLNTHGAVVYLTAGEHYFLYGLAALAGLFALLSAVIHFKTTPRNR